jgi:hypothetical protein
MILKYSDNITSLDYLFTSTINVRGNSYQRIYRQDVLTIFYIRKNLPEFGLNNLSFRICRNIK